MVSVYIDNTALWRTTERGSQLDYRRLKDLLSPHSCIRFYCSQRPEDMQRRSRFYLTLREMGYSIHPLVCTTNGRYQTREECPVAENLPEEILLDMKGAFYAGQREFVLVAGGDEYVRGVSELVQQGATVEVVFYEGQCSPSLKAVASFFRELEFSAVKRTRNFRVCN